MYPTSRWTNHEEPDLVDVLTMVCPPPFLRFLYGTTLPPQGKKFHSFKKVLRELQKDDPETYKEPIWSLSLPSGNSTMKLTMFI